MIDYPIEVIWAKILLPALIASGKMMFWGSLLGGFFGFMLAIALFITGRNGLQPNKRLYQALSAIVSSIRSFPFVVLIVAIIPVTRFVTSSSIGWVSALLPLTIASTPFFGRMFENSLKEVNPSLIEAARSFGASNLQIIFRVVVPATLPSLITASVLGVIHMLGLTTIAGTMGAGGVGSSALIYGYQSFNDNVMYLLVFIMFLIVMGIQTVGDIIYKSVR
jgi:D-methionine transport system permease protein